VENGHVGNGHVGNGHVGGHDDAHLQERPSNHNHIVPIACCQNFGRPHFRAENAFKVHVMTKFFSTAVRLYCKSTDRGVGFGGGESPSPMRDGSVPLPKSFLIFLSRYAAFWVQSDAFSDMACTK